MDFRIVYTDEALIDLREIVDYLSTGTGDLARTFGEALLDHIQFLARYPKMGSTVSKRRGIRKIWHSPYRIYYRVRDRRGIVEILHIWHGARRTPRFR